MVQPKPPRPLQQPLPTMYDLKSEDPEEPGLPDEFHLFQPQLLRETLRSEVWQPDQIFIGSDINLYYDPRHPLWYKRPDWFLALEVLPAAQQPELRLSYVIWQEGVVPFLVVELLSPGTEAEDLGQTLRSNLREIGQPPAKWEVYERILRVPYYVVFDRYENQLRIFRLNGTRYQELVQPKLPLWFDEIQLGLGIWEGVYQGVRGKWLRWCRSSEDWIPTLAERAEQEALRAEQERQRAEQETLRAEEERQRAEQETLRAEQEVLRAERLAARLRELGEDPDLL